MESRSQSEKETQTISEAAASHFTELAPFCQATEPSLMKSDEGGKKSMSKQEMNAAEVSEEVLERNPHEILTLLQVFAKKWDGPKIDS